MTDRLLLVLAFAAILGGATVQLIKEQYRWIKWIMRP